MIKAMTNPHDSTINTLAKEGKIKPVSFITPDGIRHKANSVWAATDWLKAEGYYDRPRGLIKWEL